MPINKVVYGSTTLLDLTDSTLSSADQLMQGVTAYDRTGTKLTGTGTSGGGSVTQDQDGYIVLPDTGGGGGGGSSGLDYETGSFTVAEATDTATITFSKAHSDPPMFFNVVDATGTYGGTINSMYSWTYMNWDAYANNGFYPSSSGTKQILCVTTTRRTTQASSLSNATSTSASVPSYVTSTGLSLLYGTTTYWRPDRTYKWIAIWKPTS